MAQKMVHLILLNTAHAAHIGLLCTLCFTTGEHKLKILVNLDQYLTLKETAVEAVLVNNFLWQINTHFFGTQAYS